MKHYIAFVNKAGLSVHVNTDNICSIVTRKDGSIILRTADGQVHCPQCPSEDLFEMIESAERE